MGNPGDGNELYKRVLLYARLSCMEENRAIKSFGEAIASPPVKNAEEIFDQFRFFYLKLTDQRSFLSHWVRRQLALFFDQKLPVSLFNYSFEKPLLEALLPIKRKSMVSSFRLEHERFFKRLGFLRRKKNNRREFS